MVIEQENKFQRVVEILMRGDTKHNARKYFLKLHRIGLSDMG